MTAAPATVQLINGDGTFTLAQIKKQIGLLALHRTEGKPDAETWTITHVPTGAAAGHYHTYRIGLAAMAELAAVPGWEKVTTHTATAETRELFKVCGAIVRKYRYITSDKFLPVAEDTRS